MKMRALATVLSLSAIVLIVAGLLMPPMGVIDGSVLTAVGELFAFAALATVWHAIDKGIDAKITHGQTTLNLTNDDDKE
jgi:hypothetical protein